jgi:hypothetical protein
MLSTDVWIERQISASEMADALQGVYPEQSLEELNTLLGSGDNRTFDQIVALVYQVTHTDYCFRTSLWLIFTRRSDADWFPITVDLARRLSRRLRCKTACDAGAFGLDQSPYWSIMFDDGRAYLIDDQDVDTDHSRYRVEKALPELSET